MAGHTLGVPFIGTLVQGRTPAVRSSSAWHEVFVIRRLVGELPGLRDLETPSPS